MIGRKYTLSFEAVAVTAAQDLFELVAASGKPIDIISIRIGQSSDAGDAQDENLQIKIVRGYTTSGSGGTASLTPAPCAEGGLATGITNAEINNTTVASAGTAVVLLAEDFNVRSGYVYLPTPEERLTIAAATRAVVRITAPADSLTMSGTIVYEEVG
jgi:hypothetical protein